MITKQKKKKNLQIFMITIIDGITYKSTEHYYQQAKFTDTWYKKEIINANTPNKAKILAGQKIGIQKIK